MRPCEWSLSPRGSITASFPFSCWGWRPLSPEQDRYKLHKNVPSSFGVFPRFRRHTSCHFLINCYMEVAERQAWLDITKGSHVTVETLPGWVRSARVLVSAQQSSFVGPRANCFPALGFQLLIYRMRRRSVCSLSVAPSWNPGTRGPEGCPKRVLGWGRAARKGLRMDGDAEQRLKGRTSTSERRELYQFVLSELL